VSIKEKLEKTIKLAKEIVIIGSAFINENTIADLIPMVEECLNKEIKIILVWGGLGDSISNIKSKYFSLNSENLLFLKGSEDFHSKFVLVDDQIAWITSCNLLSYYFHESSSQEIICEIRGGHVLREIFEYIRHLIHESETARSWLDLLKFEEDFNVIFEENISKIKKFEEIIRESKDILKALIRNSKKEALYQKLAINFGNLKKQFKILRKLETAVLIENLEHRKLLRSGLNFSKGSINIATDRIIQKALGPVLVDGFNDALKRNISIKIKWGRENPRTSNKKHYALCSDAIRFLIPKLTKQISISKIPSHSHVKCMLVDNHLTLVSSYNLLAFAGNGLSEEEVTNEWGIVISSKRITNKIAPFFK